MRRLLRRCDGQYYHRLSIVWGLIDLSLEHIHSLCMSRSAVGEPMCSWNSGNFYFSTHGAR
jgi:hypothetical protein